MNLIFVVENSSPAIAYLNFFNRVLTLDLINFLPPRNQHFIFEPAVKLDCVSQTRR